MLKKGRFRKNENEKIIVDSMAFLRPKNHIIKNLSTEK
jgi:hypothetical protein